MRRALALIKKPGKPGGFCSFFFDFLRKEEYKLTLCDVVVALHEDEGCED